MFQSYSFPAPQRMIDRGHQNGIMIRTVADALAFLKKQKTRPIDGLARLGTGAKLYGGYHVDDIAARRRFHWQRVDTRANRIAANIMRQPNPLLYVITQPYTADLIEAIWDKAHWLISQHIAKRLSAAWPYRIPACYFSQSMWLDVRVLDLLVAEVERIYIPGEKWRGHTRNALFTISKRTVIHLWPTPIIDGAVIADIAPVGEGEFQATWLEQGRGNMIKVVHGFIISDRRITADDLNSARKIAAAQEEKLVAAL